MQLPLSPAVFSKKKGKSAVLSGCHFHRKPQCPLVMIDHVVAYKVTFLSPYEVSLGYLPLIKRKLFEYFECSNIVI